MKIAIVAAGFTPEEADQLRRAMATFRKTGTIRNFGERMVEGMKARGYDTDFAERCFRQIEGFGEYGFPESHAASFALLVYVSCWIKCQFPDVFACALLNAQPMGFYAPAQIVRDFREHGGEARHADINHSDWNYTLEEVEGPMRALTLGFRQIKGFAEDDARAIVAARDKPFASLEDFAARTRLRFPALKRLADADAFRSLGLDRRAALWAVSRYRETGTPADMLEGLPLFDAAKAEPLGREAGLALPDMKLGEHVVQDYISLRMSLKAHPMQLLRGLFAGEGYVFSRDLAHLPVDRFMQVAGVVLVRQRPGTASGVIFATIEDETGVANIIVWPKVFQRFRRIVMGARLIGVRGRLQREQGVIHVVADRLVDMSPRLALLSHDHGLATDFHANADEAQGPCEDPRDITLRRKTAIDTRTDAILPQGRNFQ